MSCKKKNLTTLIQTLNLTFEKNINFFKHTDPSIQKLFLKYLKIRFDFNLHVSYVQDTTRCFQ